MSLSHLRPGTRAVIKNFTHSNQGDGSLVQRLMEMGLTVGTPIEVAHLAPFGGAIAVRCRGTLIALRTIDASQIEVQTETEH